MDLRQAMTSTPATRQFTRLRRKRVERFTTLETFDGAPFSVT